MNSLNIDDLKPISVEDRDIFLKYLSIQGRMSCECNFASLLSWGSKYDFRWTKYKNYLIVYCGLEKELLMPPGDFMSAEEMKALAEKFRANNMGPGTIYDVPDLYLAKNPNIKDFFEVSCSDDQNDYIYSTSKLCRLDGKRLRKKRNLIKQFQHEYPDFRCVPLDDHNKDKVLAMALAINSKLPQGRFIDEENHALKTAFAHLTEIRLQGVVLYAEGDEIAGMSVFSRLNPETYDIHFEKTNHNYKGASQMLVRQVACALHNRSKYLNREQDMGVPGLRKAKKSLDPVYIYKRYNLTLIDNV
ncbi:MAG: DUF2156 domain-containing protein [Lentisphaerae bacterium]|nr:DUF2156 domain-containing protein [Lentisphaerota bacterium]MCP4100033.1 DUF2156 domain-containing protein [Lentisphaerota bacterium]